jgi:hypothetical protein
MTKSPKKCFQITIDTTESNSMSCMKRRKRVEGEIAGVSMREYELVSD